MPRIEIRVISILIPHYSTLWAEKTMFRKKINEFDAKNSKLLGEYGQKSGEGWGWRGEKRLEKDAEMWYYDTVLHF